MRFVMILCIVLAWADWSAAADFVVAPGGNDAAAGSGDAPFASVHRAVEAVREMRKREPNRDKPIVVEVRGGVYELASPIALGLADSGTAQSPTIYHAAEGQRPVLSGGTAITGWTAGPDGRWTVTLDRVREGKWNFAQLFVNDQRRPRPRLPERGYFKVERDLPPTEKNAKRGFDRFIYKAGDVPAKMANRDDVEMYAIHVWAGSRLRIAEVDEASRTMTFTGPTRGLSDWCSFKDHRRYFLENVKEALKSPGQWYLDRPTGVLTYIPMPGQTVENTRIVAPRIDELLVIEGQIGGPSVEHVQFKGLTFAHANWVLPAEGQSFPQAEVHLDAAVTVKAARQIVLEDCAVVHVGEYGVSFGAGARDSRMERCELVDLGGGGVKIGITGGKASWGDGKWDDPNQRVSGITVRDCTIAHAGRIHPAAVGVWIGHADHNTIEHNDLFELYYSGLSVGWTWGYHEPSRAHHNRIAFNHVHTIGQRVLSDMGGIYTLGVSPGTVVTNNVFHNIHSNGYGGWGMYTDEGSTGIIFENNLVYDTKDGSFHQHYGRENIVRNNILINSQQYQLRRTRVEDHTSFTIERNIIYWNNPSAANCGNWKKGINIDRNLYFNPVAGVRFVADDYRQKDVRDPKSGTIDLAAWQKLGHDANSIIADPLFVDPAKADYRLKPESPAKQIGFVEFDFSKAGRLTPRKITGEMPAVPRTFE
jgi:hypothetical protein